MGYMIICIRCHGITHSFDCAEYEDFEYLYKKGKLVELDGYDDPAWSRILKILDVPYNRIVIYEDDLLEYEKCKIHKRLVEWYK